MLQNEENAQLIVEDRKMFKILAKQVKLHKPHQVYCSRVLIELGRSRKLSQRLLARFPKQVEALFKRIMKEFNRSITSEQNFGLEAKPESEDATALREKRIVYLRRATQYIVNLDKGDQKRVKHLATITGRVVELMRALFPDNAPCSVLESFKKSDQYRLRLYELFSQASVHIVECAE